MEHAGQEFSEIACHPAGNGRVVHHQQIAADKAEPAVDMPLAAGLFKRLVAQNGALPARAADRKLHRQHGDTHDNKADKVKQDEIAAAVLTRYVRKAPDVSDADSAACADKQKSESGAE